MWKQQVEEEWQNLRERGTPGRDQDALGKRGANHQSMWRGTRHIMKHVLTKQTKKKKTYDAWLEKKKAPPYSPTKG